VLISSCIFLYFVHFFGPYRQMQQLEAHLQQLATEENADEFD
jgi:hypothetical protein